MDDHEVCCEVHTSLIQFDAYKHTCTCILLTGLEMWFKTYIWALRKVGGNLQLKYTIIGAYRKWLAVIHHDSQKLTLN